MTAGHRRIARKLAITALLPLATIAAPVSYRLDPAHTFAHFEVQHFNTSRVRGRFGPLQGEVTLDTEAQRGSVSLVIETASLNTGLPILDARLRERDLLDVAGSPQAYFVAERMVFDGPRIAELRGEFTLRGVSVPLSLRAQRYGCQPGPPERCGGDFEGELLRSAFGATFGLPFVGDRVRLRIQVEGVRQ